jgi:hypothetical protein
MTVWRIAIFRKVLKRPVREPSDNKKVPSGGTVRTPGSLK